MTVAGRTTVYDVVGDGSEARLDFALGTRLGVGGELYRPIGVPWLFAAPRAFAGRDERNRFAGGRLVGEYRRRQADAGFDLGVTSAAGQSFAWVWTLPAWKRRFGLETRSLPEATRHEQFASARLAFDGQDSPVVPSRGVYARASARRFFSAPAVTGQSAMIAAIENPQEFWQAEFSATGFHSFTRRNRMFFWAAAGTSFSAHPYFNDFVAGRTAADVGLSQRRTARRALRARPPPAT